MSGYNHKDEVLPFENTIVNDFELDKSAVISETILRKSVQLEKGVQVKFFHLRPETSQTDKHTFCTKVVEDFEKEMGRKYAVYARTRPDALIYGNLKRLIDFDSLNKSSFIVKCNDLKQYVFPEDLASWGECQCSDTMVRFGYILSV